MNNPANIPELPHSHDSENDEPVSDDVVGKAVSISLAVLVLLGATAGLIFVSTRKPELKAPENVVQSSLPEKRELAPLTIPTLPFENITESAGIDFVHHNGAEGEKLLPETMGGGGAFFDFDNDGDQDILCANSNVWPWAKEKPATLPTAALYANDGKGRFTNVTAGSGFDVPLYGNGVACGDYDNDGLVDVFITTVGQNRLFRNTGGGKFADVTATARVAGTPDSWSTSAGFFDYNNDGWLDLFVCNYIEWSREKDLSMEFTLEGKLRSYGRPTDFIGAFPYLYLNHGNGTFSDVSAEAGVQVRNPATGTPLAKSLGVTFADVNADSRLDVIVANDTVQNLLFLSQPDGRFLESAATCGVAYDNSGSARGAMGIDAGWFRNSDAAGIAIGNFANETTALYVNQTPGLSVPVFRDEAISNGVGPLTRVQLTFGILFADVDLDGRQDLFSANGHLDENTHIVNQTFTYEQAPQLLWNCGPKYDSEFMVVTNQQTTDAFLKPMVGRGATQADIDSDGDLDFLIFATGARPRLIRNDQSTGHHWLRLKLQGKTSNRDAIGAVVRITLADGTMMTRLVNPTRSYQSQAELPVSFGLGPATSVKSAEIHWPSGTKQSVTIEAADRLITVIEPQ